MSQFYLYDKSEKTIAAISTPYGTGGIGVIRISGSMAKQITDNIFLPANHIKISELPAYTASYGYIFDSKEKIDDVVALVFSAPHSYTGEDVVEISCHGGLYITKKVLEVVLNAGAVLAQPGEFTMRAFLNNKLSLTQAEAVMDIISAKGKQSSRIAVSALDGALYNEIKGISDVLIEYTAHLSVWADYPEENIQQLDKQKLKNDLIDSFSKLKLLLNNYDSGKIIRQGLNTVIVGKPNVGKSTLMNLLSGYDRSIVTKIPGTTRDIVQETVMLGDILLTLSDTAGIRQTDDIIENIGVKKAHKKISSADLLLVVFDYSNKLSSEDIDLIKNLKDIPSIAIINKTDLEKNIDDEYIKRFISNVVYISASTGDGLKSFEKALKKITGSENIDPGFAMLANERQKQACTKAFDFLNEAIHAMNVGMTLDAITVSIEGAIDSLLELTGQKVSDVVVNEIFSKFCVGK